MSSSLRILFSGTPYFAAHHMAALIHSHHKVVGVLTKPDRPSGRNNHLTSSAVKQLARHHDLPVFQPHSLCKLDSQQMIADLAADIIVVVAYGIILPQSVLSLPRLGCINVHASLLPRWRGAAPIQRALWAGDTQTGVTIIQMDAGLDTGAILYKATCAILPVDTSATLYAKLAATSPAALLTTIENIVAGRQVAEPQDDAFATYAKKISKEEACLDWQLPAIQLERCIRAFNPWPVSSFRVGDKLINVWHASVDSIHHHNSAPGTVLEADKAGIQIATRDGVLTLTLVQPAGKKLMQVQDFIHSRREWFVSGSILNGGQKAR